uniref:Uncharacterized protein n=1 Tax=Ditylenchus dipsaci TaxID=166011 RepID=A0A915ED14_9BILA
MNPTCRRRKRRGRRKLCSVYLLPLHLAIGVLCCCSSQAMAVENRSSGAELHSLKDTNGQQFKREVMRGGDGELLDIPYPARKFQHIWSSKEELPVLMGRHVGSPPSAPLKISSNGSSRVEEARVVAKVAGIIDSNPLLKSLNMFHLEDGDTFVDITSPSVHKPLDSSEESDVEPAKKSSSSLPLKRSVLKKKLSVGVDKAVLGAKLGSDAAVAKAYATLTESRTQNGVVDNFDEIYQIFNATMFHQAKAIVTENLKQPYPPFPPPSMDFVVPPAALTTSTLNPSSIISDYMSGLVSSSTSSTPNFTTKVLADDVVASSTPFDHTLFDEESSKLAATTITSSNPNRGTTLPVFTTSRSIRKQSSTKKTLHSSGERVVSSTPTQYNPTTAAGKFHKELEESITPPHWNIDMNSYTEQQPFEVTESLELALSTAPPTSTTTIQCRELVPVPDFLRRKLTEKLLFGHGTALGIPRKGMGMQEYWVGLPVEQKVVTDHTSTSTTTKECNQGVIFAQDRDPIRTKPIRSIRPKLSI